MSKARQGVGGAKRRDVHVRGRSANETKKEKKMNELCGVAPCIHERKDVARADLSPQRLRTRGSQCTCEGKGAVSGEKEKEKSGEPGGKGAMRADSRKEGTPYSCL